MKNLKNVCLIPLLSSCSLIATNEINPGAETVRFYDSYEQVADCQYVHEVIGTEGHWYNSLFISNRDLTQGAINDLKNQTRELDANTVHIHSNMFFSTSVTILGQAYRCRKEL